MTIILGNTVASSHRSTSSVRSARPSESVASTPVRYLEKGEETGDGQEQGQVKGKGKGKERERVVESWTPTPPPSELPQSVFWGTVYDLNGAPMGAGYMDVQSQRVIIKSLDSSIPTSASNSTPLVQSPKKTREYIGMPLWEWHAGGTASTTETNVALEEEQIQNQSQTLTVGVSVRLYVGNKAALSGGYLSMRELDERREHTFRGEEAGELSYLSIDLLDPGGISGGCTNAKGDNPSEELLFIIAKALAAIDPGIS